LLTWLGRLGFLAYLGFLVYGALHGSAVEPRPVRGALESVRFLPFGILAALGMSRREGFFARSLGMAFPAMVLSFAAAIVVEVADGGLPWVVPGLLEQLWPGLGIWFGVWMGMTLTRGIGATLFFLPRLALYGVLLLLVAGVLAWRCLEPAPLAFDPTPATSAEKHRLYGLFREKSPLRLEEGQTAELRLASRDIDLLMAWGLSIGDSDRKSHVELGPNQTSLQASLRVPRLDRYLNLVARGRATVQDGVVDLQGDALQVGKLKAPGWVVPPLAYLVERALNGDRRARSWFGPLRRLTVDEGGLLVVYGRARLPPGFVADLFRGDGTGAKDAESPL
jgi:hypothetical protein